MQAALRDLGFQGRILMKGSDEFATANKRNSDVAVLIPSTIIFPKSIYDISIIVKHSQSTTPPAELAVKGGGCNTSPIASIEGGVVVDLSQIKHVEVSEDHQTVKVGGGALWGDVYSALEKYELMVVGAAVWFVGVGGSSTGSGYSPLSGELGLALDNVVAATVVLADGRVVKTDKDTEPDLLWAIRGGHNQFGIVAEFVYTTHPAPGPIMVGALAYPASELSNLLPLLHSYLKSQTGKHKLILAYNRPPPHFQPTLLIFPFIQGSPEEAQAILSPFQTVVKPVFERTGFAPTLNAASHGSDAALAAAPSRQITGGVLFGDYWDDVLTHIRDEWVKFTENEGRRTMQIFWELDLPDGIARTAKEDTAFPSREPHYSMFITGRHSDASHDGETRTWIREMTRYIARCSEERTGHKLAIPPNFGLGTDFETVEEIFGSHLPRLRTLKAKYDPKKVWGTGWVIEPTFDA